MKDADLYDQIAEVYDLAYADWEASTERQGAQLGALITESLGPGPQGIFDASCGIGTQALGLAGLGHRVTGSDLSAPAIERARREAQRRGLDVEYSVAELRRCREHHDREFDVVISGDNSLPHLLTDEEELTALRQLHALTRPGGLALITMRDYEALGRESPQLHS